MRKNEFERSITIFDCYDNPVTLHPFPPELLDYIEGDSNDIFQVFGMEADGLNAKITKRHHNLAFNYIITFDNNPYSVMLKKGKGIESSYADMFEIQILKDGRPDNNNDISKGFKKSGQLQFLSEEDALVIIRLTKRLDTEGKLK